MAGPARVEQKPDEFDELPAPTTAGSCLNCGAPLTGRYCSSCGQKKHRPQIGLRDFFHDLIHEFLHLDGKFWRTMRLLVTRPGQLTIEFLDGRRARYVSPLRLYLLVSAVFFTLAVSFPGAVVIKQGNGSSIKLDEKTPASNSEAPTKKESEKQRDINALSEMFLHDAAKGMFLLMPFFGLLLFVFYRRRVPFYLPHLYFSVHYHAFVFLAMSLMVLLKAPKIFVLDKSSSILELCVVIYLYLALRRVYGASRSGTICRMIGLGLIYMIGLGATFAAILAFIVLRN